MPHGGITPWENTRAREVNCTSSQQTKHTAEERRRARTARARPWLLLRHRVGIAEVHSTNGRGVGHHTSDQSNKDSDRPRQPSERSATITTISRRRSTMPKAITTMNKRLHGVIISIEP